MRSPLGSVYCRPKNQTSRKPIVLTTWSKSCLPVVLCWMANSSSASIVVTRTFSCNGKKRKKVNFSLSINIESRVSRKMSETNAEIFIDRKKNFFLFWESFECRFRQSTVIFYEPFLVFPFRRPFSASLGQASKTWFFFVFRREKGNNTTTVACWKIQLRFGTTTQFLRGFFAIDCSSHMVELRP